MGIHLSLAKQMCGVSAISIYGKQTLIKIFPSISDILPILICILPAVFALISSRIMKKFGRKTMIQCGSLCLEIALFIMFLSFMIENSHD